MIKKLGTYLSLLIITSTSLAQTIPLGLPLVQEQLRTHQLIGDFDSTISFTQLPLFIPNLSDSKDLTVHVGGDSLKLSRGFKSQNSLFQFHILPAQLASEFSSSHPYYRNNGSLLPAKGMQSRLTVGIFAKAGPLTLQLQPEIGWSANQDFELFPDDFENEYWRARYFGWNRTDAYGRIGQSSQQFLLPGQSKVMLSVKNFGFALSSENLWWGPGKRNSLILSNNSRGFNHLSLHSIRPIDIAIGHLEFQVIGGHLHNNPFDPPYPSQLESNPYRVNKNDDTRYLSGINVSFQPMFVKGFTLNFSRVIQQYWTLTRENGTYLPIFDLFFRSNDVTDSGILDDQQTKDQLLAISGRWLWTDARAEIYYQYGRNDAAWNARDFLLSPQHAMSSLFGFSKIFDVKQHTFEFVYEHIKLSQTLNRIVRDAGSWYWHWQIRQGYTHHGEVLGASIPIGSNQQHLEVNWINRWNRIGLVFERTVVDYDFAHFAFDQSSLSNRHWIDLMLGTRVNQKFNRLLLTGELMHIRSLNYQWRGIETPYDKGERRSNIHAALNIAYLIP
jgi:hypothetical protein